MFKVKLLLTAFFITSSLLILNSCTDDLFDSTPEKISDVLKDDPNYSIFYRIHERLGYLNITGTAFAPTDNAFQEYFDANGISLALENMTNSELEALLNPHYLRFPTYKENLEIGFNDTQPMDFYGFKASTIFIERDNAGEIKLNRLATITEADIKPEKGIIHQIDRVLEPLTSMDLARFEELDSFVVAMDRVDAATGIYSIIEGSGPYSIIAPSNEAFVEGLANNGWNSIADVPIDFLGQAMKEQIFNEDLKFKNESSESMSSLNGNNVNYSGAYKSVSRFLIYDAKIIQFEIQGSNGTLMITSEVFLF